VAGLWDAIDRIEQILQKPTIQRARARGLGPDITSLRFRPNPPKMVTLILAVLLAIVGLSVSGTLSIGLVDDLLKNLDWNLSVSEGYWLLFASPVLLIAGSLLPGL
jgi:hypothetical protein